MDLQAEFERMNKLTEAKVVSKAAKAKKAELDHLQRLLARCDAFTIYCPCF